MNPVEGEPVNVLLGSLKGIKDDLLVELTASVVRRGNLNGIKELDRTVEVTVELVTDESFSVGVKVIVVTVEGSGVTVDGELEPVNLYGRRLARGGGVAVEVGDKENGVEDTSTEDSIRITVNLLSRYVCRFTWVPCAGGG